MSLISKPDGDRFLVSIDETQMRRTRLRTHAHGHTRVTCIPTHTLRICIWHRYAIAGHPLRRNGFGLGQSVSTPPPGQNFGHRPPRWGEPRPLPAYKGFTFLCHIFIDPSVCPFRLPLRSRRCAYTCGESEVPSRAFQGAVRRISSKKPSPVSEYTGSGTPIGSV